MHDYSVAVVEAEAAERDRLVGELGAFEPAPFSSLEALEARLIVGVSVVVVIGPSFGVGVGLAAAERFALAHPECGVVLVVSSLSTEVLQRSLRAGMRDVLAPPIESGQLASSVERVGSTFAPAVAPRPAAPTSVSGELGRVVTVFSTKGGAGKSVIAANLAVTLARRSDRPVVLVDADLQFGDIAVMLKLAPQHTIVDAVGNIDRLDNQLVQNLLIRHEASGLFVLPAPLEPAFADQVSGADMVKIVQLLREMAAYVIVDTPAYFNEVVLGLLEESDEVLLVAGMDIPSIKNVKIGLQTLRLLNVPLVKLKLVLNRANSKVKLDVSEVERTLQMNADCLVPSEITIPQSVNKGTAVVLDAPRSGATKAIEELADLFLPVGTGKKKR
ncbi:MAG: CpaE family protein [Acidimicrobiia bacterium]